jgi:hypothetical protein
MYAWIALAVVVFFCFLYARSKVNISVEPFAAGETPKDVNDKLAARVSELKDSLNMATYNDAYSDMLITYDDWVGLSMIEVLNSTKMAQPADKMIDRVRIFNDLCDFKRNLNLAMTFVDKA